MKKILSVVEIKQRIWDYEQEPGKLSSEEVRNLAVILHKLLSFRKDKNYDPRVYTSCLRWATCFLALRQLPLRVCDLAEVALTHVQSLRRAGLDKRYRHSIAFLVEELGLHRGHLRTYGIPESFSAIPFLDD